MLWQPSDNLANILTVTYKNLTWELKTQGGWVMRNLMSGLMIGKRTWVEGYAQYIRLLWPFYSDEDAPAPPGGTGGVADASYNAGQDSSDSDATTSSDETDDSFDSD